MPCGQQPPPMPWSMAPISPRCRSGWGMQISRRGGSMTSAAAGRRTVRPSRCAMDDDTGVMHWTVYILECVDKTLYTGITNDLDRRVAKHEAGKGARYTKGR